MDDRASSTDGPDRNEGFTGTVPPGSTAELTALAANLRRIADHVKDLDRRCAQVSSVVSAQVLPMLDKNADQLERLHDTLSRQCENPVDWPTMTGEQAQKVWDSLASWIENTLVPWQEINRDQLPDCWALHRPAVIQLIWLRNTYLAAHQPGAEPKLVAEWHTRWLPAALASVRDAVPLSGVLTCSPGQHLTDEFERDQHLRDSDCAMEPIAAERTTTTSNLAERTCWQGFYEQAVMADLAQRNHTARMKFESDPLTRGSSRNQT